MMLHRFFVGLAGPPGAGKSTIAHEVARRINKLWPEKASSFDSQVQPPDVAAVIPMDGFHLYRSELDAMKVSIVILLTIFVIHIVLFLVNFIVHISELELVSCSNQIVCR